jgi:hypothetical protein
VVFVIDHATWWYPKKGRPSAGATAENAITHHSERSVTEKFEKRRAQATNKLDKTAVSDI